ncbi:UNVERIFIED_CONTAM: hypothetical protein GTU68_064525, partial [Idotea baltica]|nr:hypothetical protein [Idotea baltica]
MSSSTFVAIVRDLLQMGKNVCLCRHFQLLDKRTLLKRANSDKHFIDVWPMNFFDLTDLRKEDKSSLFALQLATVLNMVPAWKKKSQLRVFLCVCSSSTDELQRQKKMVLNLLHELRIEATISILSLDNVDLLRKWSSEESFEAPPPGVSQGGASQHSPASPLRHLRESYLKEVNLLIRENSIHTAVTFMTIPAPPSDPA